MSAVALRPEVGRASLAAAMSLDELLEDMCRYGNPRISKLRSHGWWCLVEMHTIAVGSEFKIESECKHHRPIEAARQCHDRMIAALATLAKGVEE